MKIGRRDEGKRKAQRVVARESSGRSAEICKIAVAQHLLNN
jgi:hypothetical protein